MTFRTELVCPSKVLTQVKSLIAQILTLLSPEAVATHCGNVKCRQLFLILLCVYDCVSGYMNKTNLINRGKFNTPYSASVTFQ